MAHPKPVEKTEPMAEPKQLPGQLPLLPVRDAVYFPHMIFPLVVGREKSIRALDEALASNRHILLVAQKQMSVDDPAPDDIYQVGICAEVMQLLRVPDGTVRVMLEGLARAQIIELVQRDPCYRFKVKILEEREERTLEIEAQMRSVKSQFEQIVNLGRAIPPDALFNVINIDEPGKLADTITPYLPIKVETKQEILETLPVRRRLESLALILQRETEILEIQRNIRSRVEREMGESQREFILREQLKAIQQELGEQDERTSEIEEYRQKIVAAQMPDDVQDRAVKELERLERIPMAAPEGVVIRTYLDWMVSLPWNIRSEETLDIKTAQKVLDEDHYGLQKVKERVLEFLAVRKLTKSMKGPILCFAGPPGVGKTSIAKSIARALARKFVRMSLGGVRDEAEIRGHRRTYVGALPGRIIQGMKTCGTRNPVFVLDEIDKLGVDFRGDPSSALLEALDPEQNNQFSDHYLEVAFDLSEVMFLTTANWLDPIPPALRDRMEVIEFAGYIETEKKAIATHFLIPKQLRDHGLVVEKQPPKGSRKKAVIEEALLEIDDSALQKIVREYTREAGVRNLERNIATICRKTAKKVAAGKAKCIRVKEADLPKFLGQPRFHFGTAEEKDEVGCATGLVYTEFGGDVVKVEVGIMRGQEGSLTMTGQLGDVMQESAKAALTYVRSSAARYNIDEDFFHKTDIHIHVPSGSVPKDGPSAGVTMATALASVLTGRPVKKGVAMTGEITLRGKVLPVGGIKEKVMSAHRAGINTVILPSENRRDLEEVPANVRKSLRFIFVEQANEVLDNALLKLPAAPKGRSAS